MPSDSAPRNDGASNAIANVVGAKLAELGEFAPLSLRYGIADAALDALRALPVEQRMEAMGMVPYTNNHLTYLYESAGSKAPTLWREHR